MAHIYFEFDDIRQSWIVAKNEMIKSFRGKKFLASLFLILLVFALITIVPFITGKGWADQSMGDMLQAYLSYVNMFVVLIVGLIGSVAIVSEYEERTALILFTRPIKKTTVFLGKFVSSVIVAFLLVLVYYAGVSIMTLIYEGAVSEDMLQSLCMCFMYLFAATGISFVFSSLLKKTSVCIIFTILAIMVVIPVISMMITGDTWYMLDSAGNSILTCIPEYVDSYNAQMQEMSDAMNTIINALRESTDPAVIQILPMLENVLGMMMSFFAPIENPTLWKEALVMFGWGFVSLVIAWVAFLRREF